MHGAGTVRAPVRLTLEEQEDLEDEEANRSADAALAEMETENRRRGDL